MILAFIAEKPRYSYEIIKELGERVGGDYSPSPGVVYPTLTMLEEMGYAQASQDPQGRKLYGLTPEGEKVLADNKAQIDAIFAASAIATLALAGFISVKRATLNLVGASAAPARPRRPRRADPGDSRRARRGRQGGRARLKGAGRSGIGKSTDCGSGRSFLSQALAPPRLALPGPTCLPPTLNDGSGGSSAGCRPDAGDHPVAQKAGLALGAPPGRDIADHRRVPRRPAGVRPLDVAARPYAPGRRHPAPAARPRSCARLARAAPAKLVRGGGPHDGSEDVRRLRRRGAPAACRLGLLASNALARQFRRQLIAENQKSNYASSMTTPALPQTKTTSARRGDGNVKGEAQRKNALAKSFVTH